MIEDQNKWPNNKIIRDQCMNPSTNSDARSFGGITKKSYSKKKKSLSDKIDNRIDEEVLGLTEPEILVTLAPNSISSDNVDTGTSSVTYTITGSPNDLNIVDNLIKSLESGGNGINGIIRVSKHRDEKPEETAEVEEPCNPVQNEIMPEIKDALAMIFGMNSEEVE